MNVVERHQAEALARLGHSVELITRRSDPGQPDEMTLGPGITLRHLAAGPEARLAKSATDQYVADFSEAMRALPRYDLVHSHHWMSGVAALPRAREWGVPHVQSSVSYTHLRAHETVLDLVCRLLLEKKKKHRR